MPRRILDLQISKKVIQCVKDNDGNATNCNDYKEVLMECGMPAFVKANTDPTYHY